MTRHGPLFVMGDVHGQFERVIHHLVSSELVTEDGKWAGGTARLWFIGDFFDRGPQGLDIVNLIRGLQPQATDAGGEVGAIMGNHEAVLLSVLTFAEDGEARRLFLDNWLANGGRMADAEQISGDAILWLARLPALSVVDNILLAHSDSDFYLRYGDSLTSINDTIRAVIESQDPGSWYRLLSDFSERHIFEDKTGGLKRLRAFLSVFGAGQLVHGHTPIDTVYGRNPKEIAEAWVYAQGLSVNVDGGMYRGGPGFLYRIPNSG